MKTVAICNQKGGVGKTSIVSNLLAAIDVLHPNMRKLGIDLDPQGHFSYLFLGEPESFDPELTASKLFQEEKYTRLDIIHRTRFENVDIVPSNILLFGARRGATNMDRGFERVREYLELIDSTVDYDICLIDTPPDLGIFVVNGLYAADFLLIPTDLGYLSVRGINDLMMTVNEINDFHPGLNVLGVLPNKLNKRLREHKVTMEQLRDLLGGNLLEKLAISTNAPLSRSVAMGQTIFEYDSQARAYKQFKQLARWVLKEAGINGGNRKKTK